MRALFFLTVLSSFAFSHALHLFATQEGDRVAIYSYFYKNSPSFKKDFENIVYNTICDSHNSIILKSDANYSASYQKEGDLINTNTYTLLKEEEMQWMTAA